MQGRCGVVRTASTAASDSVALAVVAAALALPPPSACPVRTFDESQR